MKTARDTCEVVEQDFPPCSVERVAMHPCYFLSGRSHHTGKAARDYY